MQLTLVSFPECQLSGSPVTVVVVVDYYALTNSQPIINMPNLTRFLPCVLVW